MSHCPTGECAACLRRQRDEASQALEASRAETREARAGRQAAVLQAEDAIAYRNEMEAERDAARASLETATSVLRACSALECHAIADYFDDDGMPLGSVPEPCGTCPPCRARTFLASPQSAVPGSAAPHDPRCDNCDCPCHSGTAERKDDHG